jgi:histidyl-tRNA synthetase
MTLQPLNGFRDFFPPQFARRAYIFATWRAVAARYGFEEYDGPPLESLELYTRKSGDEIVGQLYSFTDKGGREVALRPEMTPTLARMVAAQANGLKKPVRWFSIPQLFRYERTQKGRLREHFQLNCDLLGEAGPLADAEIVALAIDVMRAFGLGPTDVRVRLSDRRLLNGILGSLEVPEAAHLKAYQLLDKLGRAEEQAARDGLLAEGVDAAKIARILAVKDVTDLETLYQLFPEAAPASAPLRTMLDALEALGVADWVDLDPSIVRGLAYYTGTVFELFDAGRSLRAICGGGRYDGLLAAVGGVQMPALGFGMGDVVLGELLEARGLWPAAPSSIDVFVAGVTPEDGAFVLRAVRTLRDAGFRTEFALGQQAVGKQLKLADARSARCAVVIGPDDRVRGEVNLKDLAGGAGQQAVPLADLVARVRALLSSQV